ncbi:hypothetical protein [Streptomyces sp. RerS4]|uniref:hypothetical protein n=1 Tax=Streptomyces sp. RerS4 TaxID=2942449 RepID=UPI00201C4E47|nr:hypothetical protein [Streptomyces sp. RerS4]UQW99408.1 hypothetical protein M4D82_01840 [Streptomyces sp. RerS4]
MVIQHHITRDILHVKIAQELNVSNRSAAALEVEALVQAHRPLRVAIELPKTDPSPMTLSALGRVHRMCQSLGVPLTVTGPGEHAPPLPLRLDPHPVQAEPLEHGARQNH